MLFARLRLLYASINSSVILKKTFLTSFIIAISSKNSSSVEVFNVAITLMSSLVLSCNAFASLFSNSSSISLNTPARFVINFSVKIGVARVLFLILNASPFSSSLTAIIFLTSLCS